MRTAKEVLDSFGLEFPQAIGETICLELSVWGKEIQEAQIVKCAECVENNTDADNGNCYASKNNIIKESERVLK